MGTEVAHATRDSDTTYEVKRSKVKVTGPGAYCGGLLYSLFTEHRTNEWLLAADKCHHAAHYASCIKSMSSMIVWQSAKYSHSSSAGYEYTGLYVRYFADGPVNFSVLVLTGWIMSGPVLQILPLPA